MSKQQHSASLQIVQFNHQAIEISQNSFQVHTQLEVEFFQPQKIDDTFELSLDENSLSFQIDQLKEQSTINNILREGSINSELKVVNLKPPIVEKQQPKLMPAIQEERKRKRKEIFEKYKQKTTENILADSGLQSSTHNDLINTIDQIFRIKSPEKSQPKQPKPFLNFKKQTSQSNQSPQSNVQITGFKKKQSTFGVVTTSFEEIGIASSTPNQPRFEPPLVGVAQNINSITEFHIPSNITEFHRIDSKSNVVIGSTNSFIVESNINRISMIQPLQEEVSRDSVEIEAFLKSEIFRDDALQKTIHKDDTSYKNIEISMVNPSIMIQANNFSPESNTHKNIEQRFGLTRDKSEAVLPVAQNRPLLERNLSERKIKIFESINIEPRTIVKHKVSNYEEGRIPVYLRQIRRRNTIYPNFYLKPKNKGFYQEQNVAFKELLSEFKKGLSFLDFTHELAYERYTILVSLQKKLLNSLTLTSFMTCGWEKVYQVKEISVLQPHENFNRRKYEYEKVKGALSNYSYIVQYYEKFDLNLQDPKAQKKYFEIRSKFWQIEKNIKMIGEDIYLLAVQEVFPSHYYEFFKALKGEFPRFNKPFQQLEFIRSLLAKYYALRQQGDILCLSQIGKTLRQMLEKMIQKTLMI